MTSLEYQKLAVRTNTCLKVGITIANEDLLHGAMGVVTESGELMDAVKKHLYYGKQLDIVNLQEEIGDILWYLAILCEWTGTTIEEQMEHNINKLRIRYPEKFSTKNALNRNVVKELEHYQQRMCSRCGMDYTSCIC